MGGLKIEKIKGRHFTPKIFSPRMLRGENDMDDSLFFMATKMHIFQVPQIFIRSMLRGRSNANSRVPFGQNSHNQSFFFFEDYFRKITFTNGSVILENILKY